MRRILLITLSVLFVLLVVPIVTSQNANSILVQSSGTLSYESSPPPDNPLTNTSPAANPALQVVGTHLEDGDGNTVYLVGSQADWNERTKIQGGSSAASKPSESWFTESDVQAMKVNGATYFEVHLLLLKDLMPTRGSLDTSYFSTWVDEYCNWASNNQMYVVLDLAAPYGSISSKWKLPNWFWEDAGYSEPTTDEEMEGLVRDFFDTDVSAMDITRAAIETLWAKMANRYKSNPYVLFSLFNEPLMGVDCIDASTSQHLGKTYSEFMENIVDAIQAIGETNIIIINVPYVAGFPNYFNNVQPVKRNGIIWEDHGYMNPTRDYDYWCGNVDNGFARLVGVFNKPIIYGEYGFDTQDYGKSAYPETWLSLLGNMADYIDSKDGGCGRQWHQWGALDGEYYDYMCNFYTASESQTILDTVLGD